MLIFPPKNFAAAILQHIRILGPDIFVTRTLIYRIKRWPKRDAPKRRGRILSFNIVADWRICTYSHPKLSSQRYSTIFEYWAPIFLPHVDWYNNNSWSKRQALKCRGGILSFNIVVDWRMCIFSHHKILRPRSSVRLQYRTLIFVSLIYNEAITKTRGAETQRGDIVV